MDQASQSIAAARFQLFLLETLGLSESATYHALPAFYHATSMYSGGRHGSAIFPVGATEHGWVYWLAPESGMEESPYRMYRTRFTFVTPNPAEPEKRVDAVLEISVEESYDTTLGFLRALLQKYEPAMLKDVIGGYLTAIGWADLYGNYVNEMLAWLTRAEQVIASA